MKTLVTLLLLAASGAYAGPKLTCTTNVQEGYYVKTIMEIEVTSDSSIFVMPYDVGLESWSDGSTGTLASKKADGTSVFKGFKSSEMFGDLSEGAANKGIYVYVSKEVMSGANGDVGLAARGSEGGYEKAKYSCVKK